ncbi:MAG: alcohol dehydrogenase [Candidatus Lindowbacteria bacterium RIFCSPLOWO2_12_FULL_62_27]|nr:MAG: alcohol dehydrogenase [Candidatus Lindowbacteria bacterium RIFCSPLOWO2_12_FULL_62_27]
MRAMVYEAGRLTLNEQTRPTPGPGEILIRVHACAVCHTDLHIVDGEIPAGRQPVILGHQAVGVVESAGEGVEAHLVGARVGVPWLHSACGECDRCRQGDENLCEGARFTGYHVNGGFAEYLVARADFAPPIPAAFDDLEAAPLLCAGVIGYRTLRIAGVRKGDRLGLFGFGASAHLALQMARSWGCEVYAFTRNDAHRRMARTLGAAWAGDTGDPSPAPLDCAAVFAPAGAVVVQALRQIRKGGTVAVNAIHMRDIPAFEYALLYGERGIRSVTNCTRRDATEFLDLAARIPIRVSVERYDLSEANTALDRIRRRETQGAAVLEVTGISSKS